MSFLMLVISAVAGAAVAAAILISRQARAAADHARVAAELSAAKRALDEQRLLLTETPAQIRDAFASLSRTALTENRTDFLQNAGDLLRPVRETLDKVQAQLTEVDKGREGAYRAVSAELRSLGAAQEQLRATAEGLSRSLRSPNVRGKWGEVQLKRIVELAGMLEQCDFWEKEVGTTSDGSRQTPDLVVRLPGNANIVVDSKVPIDAFLSASNAHSETERDALLIAHARQLKEHVRALGGKEYWRQFDPAPEFVVMFLPLEPLLASAFEKDGNLFEFAATMRVIPATPMTLLALLKAVAYGWQQQAVARNTEEIQTLGRELYDRLATMVEHLDRMGGNLRQAADNYNNFIGSLEQKVLPSARRFKDLGVSSTKALDAPESLNFGLRRVKKEELTARADEGQVVEAESRFRPSLFEDKR